MIKRTRSVTDLKVIVQSNVIILPCISYPNTFRALPFDTILERKKNYNDNLVDEVFSLADSPMYALNVFNSSN